MALKTIYHKGGLVMIDRNDEPDYQCTKCYKPCWHDQLETLVTGCINCHGPLRKLSDEEPLITE